MMVNPMPDSAETQPSHPQIADDYANLRRALNDAAIIAVTDVRGKIIFANDLFCKISQYSRDELIGQDHRIVNSGYHPKEFMRDLWRAIAGGKVWRGEIRNRAKDGTLYWVDTTIIPILDIHNKPQQYMAIRYDITEYKKAQEAIQLIPQKILQAHEEERLRISKEIHDDLGQQLIALKIYLVNNAMDLVEKYPDYKPFFNGLKIKINSVIEKTRDLSHSLSPLSLKHISLAGALKELIESMSCDKNVSFRFLHRNVKDIDLGQKKIMIYRIVQGALMNVIRHAEAKAVEIRLNRKKDKVYLTIKDDGKGFNVQEKKKSGGGFGLALMKERAQLIGGRFSIKSASGSGTEIRLAVPIEDIKNEN